MKRFLPLLLLATSCPFFGQSTGHRQNTVLQRGNNTSAVVVPFAQIRVCVAGTASTGCTSQPVYSNYALTLPALQPIVADKSGNYDYYTGTACVDEIISSPGTATRVLPYVCNVATAGVGSVTAVSATGLSGLFGANVANPNTTPALSFTAISQPNSTIFGNFSGSSAAPQFYTLTAGSNMSFGVSGNVLTLNAAGGGGSMVYPGAGIAVSTGTAWGASVAAPTGTIVGTSDTQTLTNKTVDGVSPTTFGFLDATSSIQTQLNAKAPLASPTFSGTATANNLTITGTCTGCGGGGMVYPAAGLALSTGSAWGSSVAAPVGAIVGTTDTQTLTNKTVDGVNPTTFGYLDATSSVQTQLNSKLSGSGTVGQLAKFTGSAAVSSSLVSDDGTTLTYSGTGGMQLTGSGSSFIATGTTSNTDLAGKLTLSAGSATYTFARTHASAPICVATDTTATNAVKVSTTTTVLTITGTGTDAVNYICIGGTS